MINCGNIEIPEYFSHLLCINMQASKGNFDNLTSYIEKNAGFYALIQKVFPNIDEKIRIDVIVKSLGWNGFRNQVAALLLAYLDTGVYPNTPDIGLVNHILAFEETLKPFTIEGYSRSFLMALYIEMSKRAADRGPLYKASAPHGLHNLTLSEDLLELLSFASAKTIEIDWVVILLWHFKDFFGKNQLRDLIENNTGYTALYGKLNTEQRFVLLNNLLRYGYAVNDGEIFYSEMV
ncbi:MAG: hypothetical protein ISR65_14780 [Bacteriovoracaceae bacterium]|nr:hypothetical protein [Bacteriovoracaceae bacterium]